MKPIVPLFGVVNGVGAEGEMLRILRSGQIASGPEVDAFRRRFADVIGNMWAIVFRSLKFQGFNLVISQAAVVFPFIVQAPRLLSKQITLGDVMQTAQAFGQVEGALSFFRQSYDEFSKYRAVINRLSGFMDSMDAAEQLPTAQLEAASGRLSLSDLTVKTPAAVLLVGELSFTLPEAASLLIRG